MKKLLLLFIIICTVTSCESKKEHELQEREKAIILKEEQFAAKEANYKSLLLLRDSIRALNNTVKPEISLKVWPDSLSGIWNSKMVCRESNCSNYVIGDQRSEVWQFTSDSTGIYTNVLNNKKLVRTFKAKYTDNKILLDFISDSTSKGKVKMNVILYDIKKNVIKGTQTITGQDNCTAKFSVELAISPKK